MELKFKTSIVCNKPTKRGNVYTEELLEQAFDHYLSKTITLGLLDLTDELPDWPDHLPINQIAFEVADFSLDYYGCLWIHVSTLNTDAGRLVDHLSDKLVARCFLFSPKWVDDDENKVVDDLVINGFTLFVDK
jgi:hypothetical protein